ncbi:hypothetical protein LCGC14_2503940, partial [marine sediment metagenome]
MAALGAAELEEQAKARRAELERADTAYWKEMGEGNNERGIRFYLERYPDGRYAEVARENLEILEQRKRNQTSANESQAWNDAVRTNTEQSYQAYLTRYPTGSYTNEAAARIKELRARPDPAIEQARAEEDALNMAPLARRLSNSTSAECLSHRKPSRFHPSRLHCNPPKDVAAPRGPLLECVSLAPAARCAATRTRQACRSRAT